MIIKDTELEGVKIIEQFRQNDARGSFIKTFHSSDFLNSGIHFQVKESFYSISTKNVIRGMHFHLEPYAHDKIVFCTAGKILDVALDIRIHSPTFGQYVCQELSAENNVSLFILKGYAHGFLCLSEEATTYYLVSGEYHANADKGIMFDSFGFKWPTNHPILNQRDMSFETINEFYNKK